MIVVHAIAKVVADNLKRRPEESAADLRRYF
jgi:hypothetical protein